MKYQPPRPEFAAPASTEPRTYRAVVEVCPDCDIADCAHIRARRATPVQPVPASPPVEVASEPVQWGDPKTVGMLIRQLQTIDPAAPIYAAFHAEYQGKSRAFVRGITLSRERVAGRFIDSQDKSVPYSHVIWSQPATAVTEAASVSCASWPTPIGYVTKDARGAWHFFESAPYLDNALDCFAVFTEAQMIAAPPAAGDVPAVIDAFVALIAECERADKQAVAEVRCGFIHPSIVQAAKDALSATSTAASDEVKP